MEKFDKEVVNLYNLLFSGHSWVNNKIDTYSLEHYTFVTHKVSLTYSWDEIRRLCRVKKGQPFYLPIGDIVEGDVAEFSFLGDKAGLTLITREEANELCFRVFEYLIIKQKIKWGVFDDKKIEFIQQRFNSRNHSFQELFSFDSRTVSKQENSTINEIRSSAIVEDAYKILSDSRILIARCEYSPQGHGVIKYSLIERLGAAASSKSYRMRLGLNSYEHVIHSKNIDTFIRTDIVNFEAPSGTKICEASTTHSEYGTSNVSLIDNSSITYVDGHATFETRNRILDPSLKFTALRASFALIPNSLIFPFSASVISLLIFIMLVVGGSSFFIYPDAFLPNPDGGTKTIGNSSSVTILSIIPSMAAIFLSAPNEHRFSSWFLSIPRILLASSGIIAVVLAFCYSVDIRGIILLYVYVFSLIISLFSATVLTWSFFTFKRLSSEYDDR